MKNVKFNKLIPGMYLQTETSFLFTQKMDTIEYQIRFNFAKFSSQNYHPIQTRIKHVI